MAVVVVFALSAICLAIGAVFVLAPLAVFDVCLLMLAGHVPHFSVARVGRWCAWSGVFVAAWMLWGSSF
jgi:hypothetical protein